MVRQLLVSAILLAGLPDRRSPGEELRFKRRLTAKLVEQVPDILRDVRSGYRSLRPRNLGLRRPGCHVATGRCLCDTRGWNSYYHDGKTSGRDHQGGRRAYCRYESQGEWEFRKKDGSTWEQNTLLDLFAMDPHFWPDPGADAVERPRKMELRLNSWLYGYRPTASARCTTSRRSTRWTVHCGPGSPTA